MCKKKFLLLLLININVAFSQSSLDNFFKPSDSLNNSRKNTLLISEVSLATEFIKTKRIADWKKQKIDIDKRPAIFIIHKFY